MLRADDDHFTIGISVIYFAVIISITMQVSSFLFKVLGIHAGNHCL